VKRGLLLLLISAAPAIAQVGTGPGCIPDVTLTTADVGTRRVLFQPPGSGLVSLSATYNTTGTPANVSVRITASNHNPPTGTEPLVKWGAFTNTSGTQSGDAITAKGAFKFWFVELTTLNGGASPTVVLSSCFPSVDPGSNVSIAGTVSVNVVPSSSSTIAKTYYKSAALEASHAAIVTGAGNLYDVVAINNTSAANLLVQCADSLTVPVDGAVTPIVTFALGAAPNNAGWGQGPIQFSTGLSCWFSTATTTPFTKAVAGAVGIFQVTTK